MRREGVTGDVYSALGERISRCLQGDGSQGPTTDVSLAVSFWEKLHPAGSGCAASDIEKSVTAHTPTFLALRPPAHPWFLPTI